MQHVLVMKRGGDQVDEGWLQCSFDDREGCYYCLVHNSLEFIGAFF